MPLYEYQCEQCGHRFEVIQKFSDAAITVCPTCGGPVHKLLSSPAIQFKGSGWYITDYARAGKSDTGTVAAKGESSSSGDGAAAKAETTSETKSEAKADAKAETKASASSKSD
jgi:putative FmdB family regulatory protein